MSDGAGEGLALGLKLRELRLKAGLTQDGVAAGMGLGSRFRWKLVQRLENGTIRNPRVSTLGSYLRACGARWYQVVDVLDRLTEKPVEAAWLEQGGLEHEQVRDVAARAAGSVREYEIRLGRRGPMPASRDRAASGLLRYRLVCEAAELKAVEALGRTDLTKNWYPLYRAVCRQVVGRLWRMAKTRKGREILLEAPGRAPEAVRAQMESAAQTWQRDGLDLRLVQQVQQVSAGYVLRLFRADPDRFPLRVLKRRRPPTQPE
jgi:transcriptional regulator with XRE-family HTH domain